MRIWWPRPLGEHSVWSRVRIWASKHMSTYTHTYVEREGGEEDVAVAASIRNQKLKAENPSRGCSDLALASPTPPPPCPPTPRQLLHRKPPSRFVPAQDGWGGWPWGRGGSDRPPLGGEGQLQGPGLIIAVVVPRWPRFRLGGAVIGKREAAAAPPVGRLTLKLIMSERLPARRRFCMGSGVGKRAL